MNIQSSTHADVVYKTDGESCQCPADGYKADCWHKEAAAKVERGDYAGLRVVFAPDPDGDAYKPSVIERIAR